MGAATDISGRFIRFEFGTDPDAEVDLVEMEIISGSVTDVIDEQYFLPIGRTVKNIVTHGRTVTATFQGVLLVRSHPWNYFVPDTDIYDVYITANRGGSSENVDYGTDYPEIWHYFAVGKVTSITHSFDTSTHQVFDVTIVADGSADLVSSADVSYVPPASTIT